MTIEGEDNDLSNWWRLMTYEGEDNDLSDWWRSMGIEGEKNDSSDYWRFIVMLIKLVHNDGDSYLN